MAYKARVIAENVGRTEGPVLRQNGELLFTSMDLGYLYRMKGGKAEIFGDTGGSPNGATEAKDGRIYITQASGRHNPDTTRRPLDTGGIQVVDTSGKVDWLTQDPIAPNDLCFGPDGWLYFTDPTRPKHGQDRRDDGRLFRIDVATGECVWLTSLPWYPNGLAFGADEKLYVASTGESRFARFTVENGKLGKEETFCTMVSGRPDGFLFDADGNLTTAALPYGNQKLAQIQVYDRAGKLVDTFEAPDEGHRYTNVVLGPEKVLYLTDVTGGRVLAIDGWPHAGLALHPFRG